MRWQSLFCEVGDEIIVPGIVASKKTEKRIIDIDRLIITCTQKGNVLPDPTWMWFKDNVPVIRGFVSGVPMIHDAFLMLERNALLFMIQPVPIMVTNTLSVMVDFRTFNVSPLASDMLDGMEMGDIHSYVLDSIVGKWTCDIENAFGNDSKTSLVTGELVVCHSE